MNIWEFINSFLYGLLTGGSLFLAQHGPAEGHPAYSTAWLLGMFVAVALWAVMLLLVLPPHLGYQP